jgi:hypothetical protein
MKPIRSLSFGLVAAAAERVPRTVEVAIAADAAAAELLINVRREKFEESIVEISARVECEGSVLLSVRGATAKRFIMPDPVFYGKPG